MSKVIKVTDNELKGFLTNNGVSILQFSAPWCAPCKAAAPIIEELAVNNVDVQVGKLNVDEAGTSAAVFAIRHIPAIIFFKDGEKVKQVSGTLPLQELQKILDGIKV